MPTRDHIVRQRDPTIYENFLEKTIVADRKMFTDVILSEDSDSVVFLYSTENVNYIQRKAAYQFNLAAETILNTDKVGDKIKFYSYDAYQHTFPKGIPFLSAPPQDTRGTEIVS